MGTPQKPPPSTTTTITFHPRSLQPIFYLSPYTTPFESELCSSSWSTPRLFPIGGCEGFFVNYLNLFDFKDLALDSPGATGQLLLRSTSRTC